MVTEATATYKVLLRDHVGPELRQRGLKGSGGEYMLPSQDDWLLVGFQRDGYGSAEGLRFTVNVASLAKWQMRSRKPSANVSMAGMWWTRLGNLDPEDPRDRWWTVLADSPPEHLAAQAAEVLALLDAVGLPALRARVGADPLPR